MKRQYAMSLGLILFLAAAVAACAPPMPTLVPIDTVVALTMVAMQPTGTDTSTPAPFVPSATPEPTNTPAGPILELPMSAPGVQCVPPDSTLAQARVLRVVDGDTLEVSIGNDVYQVRYLGANAPSSLPPIEWHGGEAFAANRDMTAGQVVLLAKDNSAEIDQQGRLLRYVFAGNNFVNFELIRQGAAQVDIEPQDFACRSVFLGAENEARVGLMGIWSATPTPSVTPTTTMTPTPLGGIPTATETREPPCSCKANLKCNDFTRQKDAQSCYSYCKSEGFDDIFEDNNRNGLVCEGLP